MNHTGQEFQRLTAGILKCDQRAKFRRLTAGIPNSDQNSDVFPRSAAANRWKVVPKRMRHMHHRKSLLINLDLQPLQQYNDNETTPLFPRPTTVNNSHPSSTAVNNSPISMPRSNKDGAKRSYDKMKARTGSKSNWRHITGPPPTAANGRWQRENYEHYLTPMEPTTLFESDTSPRATTADDGPKVETNDEHQLTPMEPVTLFADIASPRPTAADDGPKVETNNGINADTEDSKPAARPRLSSWGSSSGSTDIGYNPSPIIDPFTPPTVAAASQEAGLKKESPPQDSPPQEEDYSTDEWQGYTIHKGTPRVRRVICNQLGDSIHYQFMGGELTEVFSTVYEAIRWSNEGAPPPPEEPVWGPEDDAILAAAIQEEPEEEPIEPSYVQRDAEGRRRPFISPLSLHNPFDHMRYELHETVHDAISDDGRETFSRLVIRRPTTKEEEVLMCKVVYNDIVDARLPYWEAYHFDKPLCTPFFGCYDMPAFTNDLFDRM